MLTLPVFGLWAIAWDGPSATFAAVMFWVVAAALVLLLMYVRSR